MEKSDLDNFKLPERCYKINNVQLRENLIFAGDTLKVKCEDDSESVCTVDVIFVMEGRCFLRVRWFYTPHEIEENEIFFGVAELFDSYIYDEIPLEAVIERAHVLSILDYNSLDAADDCTYYCRATFDGKKLVPPYSDWQSMCICCQIINPDVPMIQCEECLLYFHSACFSVPFVCPVCNI